MEGLIGPSYINAENHVREYDQKTPPWPQRQIILAILSRIQIQKVETILLKD
jgi:hypothetical protein